MEAFLKECDVLVASLPGTEKSKGLLDAKKLGAFIGEFPLFKHCGKQFQSDFKSRGVADVGQC